MISKVLRELEKARQQLFDLSPRNRLLNFRATRRTTIRIVDELPSEVWRLVVKEGRALGFLAREEHELFDRPGKAGRILQDVPDDKTEDDADEDTDAFFSQPALEAAPTSDGPIPDRYTDSFLQTAIGSSDLQTNLLRIDQAARSALEERGVNLLFLAVGLMEWRQVQEDEKALKAPLLLIPAKLERAGARLRFKMRAADDDPVQNPCLLAKLRADFGIDLPAPPEDWNGFGIENYLQQVETAIRGQSGWRVRPEIYLGLYSFNKYQMYVDLDANRWPKESSILDNPLIASLLDRDNSGLEERDAACLPDPSSAEEAEKPEDVYEILDTDSCQRSAILAAKSGRSFVLHGPPGTGKSQTIANIISECLAAQKTVLFVSEKMAALQVVKRRLDSVGMGEFCLELHSTKANRSSVLGQLKTTLDGDRVKSASYDEDARKLTRLRKRLATYVRELHSPILPMGITPYKAIGKLALLRNVPDVTCPMPGHESWSVMQLDAMREQLGELSRTLASVSPVTTHPWRGVGKTRLRIDDKELIQNLLARTDKALKECRERAGTLSALLGRPLPKSVSDAKSGLCAGRLLWDSPNPSPQLIRTDLWDNVVLEGKEFINRCRVCRGGQETLGEHYRAELIRSVDWVELFRRFTTHAASRLRWLRPGYWRDRRTVQAACNSGYRPHLRALLNDLKGLAWLQAEMQEMESEGKNYFGEAWQGLNNDWELLQRIGNWLRRFRTSVQVGDIGGAGIELVAAGNVQENEGLRQGIGGVDAGLREWEEAWAALRELLRMQDPGAFEQLPSDTTFDTFSKRVEEMQEHFESLHEWVGFQESLQECEKGPLADFVTMAIRAGIDPNVIGLSMETRFLHLLLDGAFEERSTLRTFNCENHEADRRDFAGLDRHWVAQTGNRLRAKLSASLPLSHLRGARSSQLGIVQDEIRRKRGKRSIRNLLTQARDVVVKIKPCFMMSPLSVAQFIDPAGVRFDVVIFDEASQVEPPDALGAIARGRQLILAGDMNQLPPTSFFASLPGEPEPDKDGEAAGLADMESILDRGCSLLSQIPLLWHYRSRHESLISFSNGAFYDGKLVVFPSSQHDSEDLGVHFKYNPEDTYARGKGQTNRSQAERIALYVLQHARDCPSRSIGVGAFGMPQQQAILDEIEKLRRHDDSLEEFFDGNKAEPFFVKNLETIQGDERDVIVLSIGYGKERQGERLSMNFGPLNKEGGWRRLNVLITRARERCVVFSSIKAEDFDLQATTARGVHALRGYLAYASSRALPIVTSAGGDFDSPFEQAVYNALVDRGIEVHCQVGCAGYAIDLAVVDAERPGKYVLGIECDGASYHSLKTVRDRDRLRQQVLEDLGWRIHRIWSTAWHQTPQKELQKLLDVISKAKARHTQGSSPSEQLRSHPIGLPHTQLSLIPAAGLPDPPPPQIVPLYQSYQGEAQGSPEDFYVSSSHELSAFLGEIVACEGPVHQAEVIRQLPGMWGIRRAGSRVSQKIEEAITHCLEKGLFSRKGDFLWPNGMSLAPVRQRVNDQDRKIELVCREEIGQAILMALELQFGMNRQDLVIEAARLLGFSNTGSRVAEAIESAIEAETKAGRISWKSE